MREALPTANTRTLSNALSYAPKHFPHEDDDSHKFTKITESEIEKIIIKKLNANLDNKNIRLAIDFLKLKRADSGLDDDLDIEKYLKKVVENTSV